MILSYLYSIFTKIKYYYKIWPIFTYMMTIRHMHNLLVIKIYIFGTDDKFKKSSAAL